MRRLATLLIALGWIVAGFSGGASAASATILGSVTDNGNGTATVTYDNPGYVNGLFICDPSTDAGTLFECNSGSFLYTLSSATNMPASPFTVTAGMPVTDGNGDTVPLPAGHYTLVLLYGYSGPVYIWAGGAPDVYIASTGTPVPDWLQAVGRESAIATCPFGWNPSWQEWPNGHTGGFVCVRVIPSLG